MKNLVKVKLLEGEKIICPAIWIDDGLLHLKNSIDNQPVNIDTGWVFYGNNYKQIVVKINRSQQMKLINLQKSKTNQVVEGYFTNFQRFVEGFLDMKYTQPRFGYFK